MESGRGDGRQEEQINRKCEWRRKTSWGRVRNSSSNSNLNVFDSIKK